MTDLDRAARDLDYAETNWHQLGQLHTATAGNKTPGGTRTEHPTPLRLEVHDTAHQLAAEIAQWCDQMPRPLARIDHDARTPQARLRALRRNLPHLADLGIADWARQLRNTIAATIGDTAPGRTWTCLCGTQIRIRVWLQVREIDNTGLDVTCPGCGTRWTRDQLLAATECACIPPWAPCLQATDPWLDPEAIADLAGIPARTLRNWAQRGKVRRIAGRYHLGDIRDMLGTG